MSFEIIKRDDGGVICEVEGTFTPDVHREFRRVILGDQGENLPTLRYVIVDFSRARNISHSGGDLREFSYLDRREVMDPNSEILIAIVVPRDVFFGLSRVWHSYLQEETRTNLFRTREEAENWIRATLPRKD